MTSNPVSNSNAIRADSVEIWNPLKRKYQSIQESVVGLAPEDLNSIELLAQAIGNDPTYFRRSRRDSQPKRTQPTSRPTSPHLRV